LIKYNVHKCTVTFENILDDVLLLGDTEAETEASNSYTSGFCP